MRQLARPTARSSVMPAEAGIHDFSQCSTASRGWCAFAGAEARRPGVILSKLGYYPASAQGRFQTLTSAASATVGGLPVPWSVRPRTPRAVAGVRETAWMPTCAGVTWGNAPLTIVLTLLTNVCYQYCRGTRRTRS